MTDVTKNDHKNLKKNEKKKRYATKRLIFPFKTVKEVETYRKNEKKNIGLKG